MDVYGPRLGNRLAHVDGFDLRQLIGIGLDQVGQAMQQALALQGLELAPGAAVELRTGGKHGLVEVICGAHGNVREHPFGGRLDHLRAATVGSLSPGAANEQFLGFAEEALGRFGNAVLLQVVFCSGVHRRSRRHAQVAWRGDGEQALPWIAVESTMAPHSHW
ncbi:hypothetical protein D3C76_1154020 [compost metagenome]